MSDSEDSSLWTDEDDDDDEEDEDEEEDEDVGDEWKNSIKVRMEQEIARRVADALPETPPLERLRRRQEAAKRAAELADMDLNAHLDFTGDFYKKDAPAGSAGIRGRLMDIDTDWRRKKPTEGEEPEPEEEPETKKRDTQRQYQFYEPIKPLPLLQHYNTVTNSSLSSFDAGSIVPLIPHPIFLHIIPKDPEPLYTPIKYVLGSRTYENQTTQFTHKLRGIGVVYDSQKSPKVQKVEQPSNPLIAPNLVFESRFESGNLRQARRVGQFEYELVLKTDMYTKRHTQWYYFRVQNMVPGIIYKFRIVNLLKKDSLYNYGMRPIFYSEKTASEKHQGWIRTGHHISYGRNVQHLLCPLLNREMAYYELEWQMEFPYLEDTCYLAHCYPFTHYDLRNDLHQITTQPTNQSYLRAEMLCETKAGHDCYLLTITNFEKTLCNKKCVVVSARVHPGESNSSWMMKGLYEFLISDHPDAKELRDKFIFKIIPMLNPDGVIVGNYRCSLQARDLNRNYRWPKKDRFPTIWHLKQLVDRLQQDCGVFVYCDFHGHSRKSNVFMYGNSTVDPKENKLPIRDFLNERMLPFIISQLDPEMFSFQSSRFAIKKCKESTGRVVMFRQFNIVNSFTMEATFSGTKIDQQGSRHYNQQDFMDAGALFAKGVLQYSKVIEDQTKESAAVLELAKTVAQQLINNSLRQRLQAANSAAKNMADNADSTASTSDVQGQHSSARTIKGNSAASRSSGDKHPSAIGRTNKQGSKTSPDDSTEDAILTGAKLAMEQLKQITNSTKDSVQQCFDLLESLDIQNNSKQPLSDSSSDSDSESEPEMVKEKVKKKKKNKKNRKKDAKKQQKTMANISGDYVMRNFKPAAQKSKPTNGANNVTNNNTAGVISNNNNPGGDNQNPTGNSSAPSRLYRDEGGGSTQSLKMLPVIGERPFSPTAPVGSKMFNIKGRVTTEEASLESSKKLPASWSNPYRDRKNGGIPCYSEERSLERAAKKMAELQKKVEERVKRQQNIIPYIKNDNYGDFGDIDLQELNSLKQQKKYVQDSFNKSIRLLTQSCIPNMGFYTPALATMMEDNPDLKGQLEPILVPSLKSEPSDSGSSSSSRKKKKTLTPINHDKYSTPPPEYNSPTKWHWHPGAQPNHPKPLGSITGIKRNSWTDEKIPIRNQQNSIRQQNAAIGNRGSQRQHQQSQSRSLFPPARLGPLNKGVPKGGGLKAVLRVNPMHHHLGFE